METAGGSAGGVWALAEAVGAGSTADAVASSVGAGGEGSFATG